MKYTRGSSIMVVALMVGCDDGLIPARTVVADILTNFGEVEIIAPTTVQVGQTFQVGVKPLLGCGVDAKPALVEVDGLVAEIIPRVQIPKHAAGQEFTCEPRTLSTSVAQVRFDAAGDAVLRIKGKHQVTGETAII